MEYIIRRHRKLKYDKTNIPMIFDGLKDHKYRIDILQIVLCLI